MTVLMLVAVSMIMVVIVVTMVVITVSATDEGQGLLQNSISDLHAADCLIEQVCKILVPILSRLFSPFPKIFSVMKVVFNPVGQQYPQLVDGGFLFHFLQNPFDVICC